MRLARVGYWLQRMDTIIALALFAVCAVSLVIVLSVAGIEQFAIVAMVELATMFAWGMVVLTEPWNWHQRNREGMSTQMSTDCKPSSRIPAA